MERVRTLADPSSFHHEEAIRKRSSRAAIGAAYFALFILGLPAVLWALGRRFDAWLAWPAPVGLVRGIGVLVGSAATLRVLQMMWVLSRRGEGLPISHLPPARLVTSGGYARVRHPIYLAFNVAFTGLALGAGSLGAGIGAGSVLLLAWIAYALVVEEPRLRLRFGPSYAAYAASTPLLGPLPAPVLHVARGAWRRMAPTIEGLANRTVAWRVGRVTIVTYGLFVGFGAFVMVAWSGAMLGALGVSGDAFLPFAIAVGASMLLGGRLAGILYRHRLLLSAPIDALRTVGFVSWGGYAGLTAAVLVGAGRLGVPPGMVLDRLALAGWLCSSIGRLGCLSYGCCGGRPSVRGVCWRNPDARIVRELGDAGRVPRLPTQLLSSALALALTLALLALTVRPLPAGAVSALALLLYGLGRATLETTREEARFGDRAWTRGQFVSLVVAATGLVACFAVDGASAWPAPAWSAPAAAWLAALPAALLCGLMSFLVTGLHGPHVGRW